MQTNYLGQPIHPIDSLVAMHYKTTITERDDAAMQYDLLIGNDPEKAVALKALLEFAVNEALCNDALSNSGADQ